MTGKQIGLIAVSWAVAAAIGYGASKVFKKHAVPAAIAGTLAGGIAGSAIAVALV